MQQFETIADLVKNNVDLLLQYEKDGYNKTQMANALLATHNTDFDPESVRKAISRYLNKYHIEKIEENDDEQNLEQELKDEFTKDELDSLKVNYEYGEKFHYDEKNDAYIFYIRGRVLRFNGIAIRAMKDSYSNLVSRGLTINQICAAYEIPRDIFTRIKTYLGWTKDSLPLTNEELIDVDVDQVTDDLVQKKIFSISQKYNQKLTKYTEDAAAKYISLTTNELNPFISLINKAQENYQRPTFVLSQHKETALVISPFDLHYGKYAWFGETNDTYNRDIARKRLIESTNKLLSDAKIYNPEKIIVPIGSDFFHIDKPEKTTTAGTPQDTDGTYVQIMVEGNMLMVDFIELLRQVAPVELYLAAGNHDYNSSIMLQQYLSAYYKDTADVTVFNMQTNRQYSLYGETLLGFTHGDTAKIKDLPMLMANEAKEIWSKAKNKAFFVGHLHSEKIVDVSGVKIYQMPSLSGSDRWHHNNGYIGSVKGMAAYVVDKTEGIKVTILSNL